MRLTVLVLATMVVTNIYGGKVKWDKNWKPNFQKKADRNQVKGCSKADSGYLFQGQAMGQGLKG